MGIAKTLKDLRLSANLTQKELADKLHIGQSTIVGYEQGRNEPVLSILNLYADFFGVSVDELLGRYEITPEERAAGARETIKISITPIEDDMLYVFRQIGKTFGEQAQRDYITVGENMLKLK